MREVVQWIEERLARKEGALGAEALANRFAEERLFGDDDDHAFRAPIHY
jgi:hypothetical protein